MTNQFTNKMQNQVKEFHETFGHPVQNTPTVVDLWRFTDRQSWGTIEEAIELLHAISNSDEEFTESFKLLMDGAREAYHNQLTKKRPKTKEEKLVAIADALADKLYFVLGDAVEAGIDIELVMNIVHKSNMSKLFEKEDGTLYAEYSDKGKVKKSPRFFEPEPKIKEEIENQIKGNKGSLNVELNTKLSDDKQSLFVYHGDSLIGNLEFKDLIPKQIMTHDGEVLFDKETAKKLSESGKILGKSIKDSVKKVKPEQVKEVIESAIESKNDDSNK